MTTHVFNPPGLGPSGFGLRWDLFAGCSDPRVAIRRARALCGAPPAPDGGDAGRYEQAVTHVQAWLQGGATT